jgi:hypothetical protein
MDRALIGIVSCICFNHRPVKEAGLEAVDVMRSIKQALDPRGILNPGKIFTPAQQIFG